MRLKLPLWVILKGSTDRCEQKIRDRLRDKINDSASCFINKAETWFVTDTVQLLSEADVNGRESTLAEENGKGIIPIFLQQDE